MARRDLLSRKAVGSAEALIEGTDLPGGMYIAWMWVLLLRMTKRGQSTQAREMTKEKYDGSGEQTEIDGS